MTFGLDAAEGQRGTDLFGYSQRGLPTFQRRSLEGRSWVLRTNYDTADRVIARRFPGGEGLDFSLDGAGRVTGVTGQVVSVGYDARGQMESMAFPNGVTTTRRYDARLRLRAIGATNRAGVVLQDESVGYDRAGNVVSTNLKGPDGAFARTDSTFDYDDGYRLTNARIARPGEEMEALVFGYDEIDNLTLKTSSRGASSADHVGSYVYGENAGPHAATTAGVLKLTYDAAGFMKTRAELELNWDFRGNLKTAWKAGAEVARYSTGAGFQRVTKKEGGHVTHFLASDFEVRDGVGTVFVRVGGQRVARFEVHGSPAMYFADLAPTVLNGAIVAPQSDGRILAADAWLAQEALEGVLTTSATVAASELDAMLLASCRLQLGETIGESRQWWLNDYRGTVFATLDSAGGPSWAIGRFPFGLAWARSGEAVDYSFEGKEEDQTALHYFTARYYDSFVGTWCSADPSFLIFSDIEGMNRLGFVRGSPTTLFDPMGQRAAPITGDAESPPPPAPWWESSAFSTQAFRTGAERLGNASLALGLVGAAMSASVVLAPVGAVLASTAGVLTVAQAGILIGTNLREMREGTFSRKQAVLDAIDVLPFDKLFKTAQKGGKIAGAVAQHAESLAGKVFGGKVSKVAGAIVGATTPQLAGKALSEAGQAGVKGLASLPESYGPPAPAAERGIIDKGSGPK